MAKMAKKITINASLEKVFDCAGHLDISLRDQRNPVETKELQCPPRSGASFGSVCGPAGKHFGNSEANDASL